MSHPSNCIWSIRVSIHKLKLYFRLAHSSPRLLLYLVKIGQIIILDITSFTPSPLLVVLSFFTLIVC
jgi:hypothetical protein